MAITLVNEYAIALPFSFDSFGGIAAATNQEKIWADRLRGAIGTTLGERIMRSKYGTEIPRESFTTVTEMEGVVRREVERVFTSQFPLLTLVEVAPTFDTKTSTINVEVFYSLPNKDEVSVSVGLVQIRPDEPLVEELR
jgi:phage baseplate assembly protein W